MEPPPDDATAPSHLRLHAVRVYVRDLDRSVAFYVERLGFRVAFDTRLHAGQRWVAVAPPDGGAVLSLVAPSSGTPEAKLIGRATQVVFVTEDVVARFREWSKRGVRFRRTPRLRRVTYDQRTADGADPPWGGVFTRFEDLDGNSFALVSFDAESRAVEAERRAASQKRAAERRAAHELAIAREVQARLFPQRLPECRTLDYAGLCLPARQVGGDYYDFLSLGAGRLGLVIGDVAGKGIAAALLMANLQANLRSQCAGAAPEPQPLLRSVNQLFRDNTTENAYATLLFVEYDDAAQRLRYANCGHLHGLLLRASGGVDRLETTATVLGLFEEWECGVGERRLARGDLLALYTDGVTEAFGASGEEFGEERVLDALRRGKDAAPRAILDGIVSDVAAWSAREQHDDITLVVARCTGN